MRRRIVFGLAAALVLALGIDGSATSDAPLKSQGATFVKELRLESRDPLFGGFSALSVGPNGDTILALSDRGAYVQGRIVRNVDGEPISVRIGPVTKLRDSVGADQAWKRTDSEGLAIGADCKIFVSFERFARISRFDRIDAVPVDLPTNEAFARLPTNEGLEALAIDAKGALYAVPEVLEGKTIPVYVFRNGTWQKPLSLPRIGNFHPVSADFGPDGRFYLLERRFEAFGGFASRLRRFTLGPMGFSDEVILMQSSTGRYDNLEGMSIWRAPDGLRATLISDDNFFALQVTELVEFRLPD